MRCTIVVTTVSFQNLRAPLEDGYVIDQTIKEIKKDDVTQKIKVIEGEAKVHGIDGDSDAPAVQVHEPAVVTRQVRADKVRVLEVGTEKNKDKPVR